MLLYALTIFASAFLLFLVQPIIAKEILPWFGGSAAVWTTCLVFFQSALLAGYAYADATTTRLSRRRQGSLHSALLVASLLLLPIVPGVAWKPLGSESPLWLILGLLTATIGLPYLLLSTTSPLLQAWFAQRHPGRNPYRLFALSNFASMLALLAYPFAIEPWITTHTQAIAWSAGYGLFVALCIAAALVKPGLAATATPEIATDPTRDQPMPGLGRHLLWASLAAVGSILLLSVTGHITENIAAVPLLWVVPLSIYLITFILCFDSTRWYVRNLVLPLAALALGGMAWAIADLQLTHELGLQLGISCVGLFLACMFCHGELARLKPAPRHLTRYYLMVSLGGALGAVLVGIVVPVVLPAHFELALGLVACAALLGWQVRRDGLVFGALAAVAAVTTIGCAIWGIVEFYDTTIVTARNFYGVLRVQEIGTGVSRHRSLVHGTILHGNQYLVPELRRQPTTYYTGTSGVGRVLDSLNPRTQPLKVGVIGLGTGTIAAWGAKGDTYRFYDINPAVIRIARTEFTYLGDSDATIETVLGDAQAVAGARGAAAIRPPRHRCLFQRRDSGPPDHVRSAGAVHPSHEARWRHRLPRDQPLSRPRSRRRGARACARDAGGLGPRRRRCSAGEQQRLGAGVEQHRAAFESAHRRGDEADRGAPRLASVDRRFQQPVPGAAAVTIGPARARED